MSGTAPRASPPNDLGPRRVSGFSRFAVALTVTALASVEVLPLPDWFAWLGGLVWLPAATWLWFAAESPPRRWRTVLGLVLDVIALGLVMALAPEEAGSVLLLAVPLAAVATFETGLVGGSAVTAGALIGWGLATRNTAQNSEDLLEAGATALVTAAVVLLLAWARSLRRREDRRTAALLDTTRSLMARSAEAIVVTDADSVILQANEAAERVLTVPPDARLAGATCAEALALHTTTGRRLVCRDGCALAALCDESGVDAVELWRPVGDRRQPLLGSAFRIHGEAGGADLLHSFRDITRLKQADEAKTMFLATASHELKTPLTVIRGFTQLLQRTVEDAGSLSALDAIESRSAELAAIIDRMLLSSRIEAGRIDLDLQPVDLSALLAEKLPMMAEATGRPVVTAVPTGLEVLANPQALTTVVDQLVSNAMKYSGPDAPIRVRASRGPDGVVVAVEDRGVGMTPDEAERCFDKFWQAESSDVRRFGGTGIGLYIVRALVEAMGGTVTVSSATGVGSTFTVALDEPPVPTTAPSDAATRPGTEDERIAQPRTVDEFMTQLGIRPGGS